MAEVFRFQSQCLDAELSPLYFMAHGDEPLTDSMQSESKEVKGMIAITQNGLRLLSKLRVGDGTQMRSDDYQDWDEIRNWNKMRTTACRC